MSQRKILLDSCSYLRLAETLHPLLDVKFGHDNCCLYVIRDFQMEYDHQPRLQNKFPSINEQRYRDNRKKRIGLSKKQKESLDAVVEAFDTYAYDEGLGTSPEDLKALATAYLAQIEFITDDDDLLAVAREYEMSVMNTLELLKLMLERDHVDDARVRAVCEYIDYIPDRPKNFRRDRQRLFGF